MERKGNKAYLVKDSKKARMKFIKIMSVLTKNKDKEHLEKYETMWSEFIENKGEFACKYYHNITTDEFQDFVLITELAKIDETKE